MPPLDKIDSRLLLLEWILRYDILGYYWPICFNLTNQNGMPPLGQIDSRFPLVERSLRYNILGSYWPVVFNLPECDAAIR
jgi:hypothetical protein